MRESAQLQREAEAQRAGLSNTLGQLREGMTSSALSTELVGVLRDSSLSVVKSLAESARTNPGAALQVSPAERSVLGKVGAQAIDKGREVLETAKDTVTEEIAGAHLGEKVEGMAGKLVDTMVPTSSRPA